MSETALLLVGGAPVALSLALAPGRHGPRCLLAEPNERRDVAPGAFAAELAILSESD